jgi:hypothetical protein
MGLPQHRACASCTCTPPDPVEEVERREDFGGSVYSWTLVRQLAEDLDLPVIRDPGRVSLVHELQGSTSRD